MSDTPAEAGSVAAPAGEGKEAPHGLPTDPAARAALLLRWANNDFEAASFLAAFADATRLTDDLADGDKVPTVPRMARLWNLMAWQMGGGNLFVQRHQQALGAVMALAGLSWEASEEWRRGSPASAVQGFVRRDDVDLVVTLVALLVGGPDHARQVMRECHDLCRANRPETVADWVAEAS